MVGSSRDEYVSSRGAVRIDGVVGGSGDEYVNRASVLVNLGDYIIREMPRGS